jgi:hypothetical protein
LPPLKVEWWRKKRQRKKTAVKKTKFFCVDHNIFSKQNFDFHFKIAFFLHTVGNKTRKKRKKKIFGHDMTVDIITGYTFGAGCTFGTHCRQGLKVIYRIEYPSTLR